MPDVKAEDGQLAEGMSRARQRALAELSAEASAQQEHDAGSSSRAFTSSRKPSWLPATHLLVPSSRITSAVAASFGSMASMSLRECLAQRTVKVLACREDTVAERGRDPEAFQAALLVLGKMLPEPLADDPGLPSPFLKRLEDVVLAGARVAAQVDLAIEAEDLHLARIQVQAVALEKVDGKNGRLGGLAAAHDQRLAVQIAERVDVRIGPHDERRADVAVHVAHHERLAGIAGLAVILGVGQRRVPGDVDLLLLERIDERVVVGIKDVIDRQAVAAEIAANALEDRHAAREHRRPRRSGSPVGCSWSTGRRGNRRRLHSRTLSRAGKD